MPRKITRTGAVADAALSHLSALLRVRRKEKNLTVGELADRLGISQPTMRGVLRGTPTVAIGTYFEAAHILGVPLFEPETSRFARNAAHVEKLDALLPQRVRNQEIQIDDDF